MSVYHLPIINRSQIPYIYIYIYIYIYTKALGRGSGVVEGEKSILYRALLCHIRLQRSRTKLNDTTPRR